MKQPVLTATLVAVTGLMCFIAGNNTGIEEGKRIAAESCQKNNLFEYSRIEYSCGEIKKTTLGAYLGGN